MFLYLNIFILLFGIIPFTICVDNNVKKRKIFPGSQNVTWEKNIPYLYYIDISDYDIQEENVVEFVVGFKNIILTTSLYVLATNKTEEEIKNETIKFEEEVTDRNKNVKKRLSSDLYVYANTFKKTSYDQTYFLILVIPTKIESKLNIQIGLSNRIINYPITKNSFGGNNIIKKKLSVRKYAEDFYKFIIKDISVKEQNIAFFVDDYNIACFYENISSISTFRGNRMHLIEKNSTNNETNHILYVGVIGEIREITIEIALIKNDIIFLDNGKSLLPFYIENMKYNEDLYIIENYGKYTNITYTENDLMMLPIYGEFNLTYYYSYKTIDLEDLFQNSNGTILDKRINKVSGVTNFYRLSCSSPCALKFGYFNYKDSVYYLKEGEVRIKYIKTENNAKNTYIFQMFDETKKYYVFYELYGNEEDVNTAYSNYAYVSNPKTVTNPLNRYNRNGHKTLYYDSKNTSKLYFTSYYGAYIKFYLTSNSLYINIVEGLNKIEFENRNKFVAFKMRRDIVYDYVLINIYSYNKSQEISIFYDVQILSNDQIDSQGRVLCEVPIIGINNQKEINFKYSNPYNKYNNRIKDDEIMVLTFQMVVKTVLVFPIYFDIKYYYNNLVVQIPHKEPKILKLDEEYKISGIKEKNTSIINNIILNINKCNLNKNYSIQIYYESLNNIIATKEIIDKRNIIFHNNVFNTSNIKLEEIKTENNSNNIKINSIIPNNYLSTDDIYMNYFTIKESLEPIFNNKKITNDYRIKYKDEREKISLKWSPYIDKNINIPELTIQYNIYIFPKNSKVNSICQMSLIPPNYTVINKTEYSFNLPKGKYKLNIIALVINDDLPLITFYDVIEIKISQKIKIIIYIILTTSIFILLIFLIILYIMKKNEYGGRRTIDRRYPYSRNSFWISLVQQRDSDDSERKSKKKKGKIAQIINDDNDD